MRAFTTLAFTPAVRAAQERQDGRARAAAVEAREPGNDVMTPEVMAYLRLCDSFFIGSASVSGRPYVQHRGGPKGFVKVIDDRTLAWAEFSGNAQYITLGNLGENDKAFLFVPDYAERRRLKLWGRAAVVQDAALLRSVRDPSYPAPVECAFSFTVEAWDFNCRQHIAARYTAAEIETRLAPLRTRIVELERALRELGSLP
jgi:predicted pyridoxine 5'-phosphate oxidase superfamily flavin-nucleotide-binding protein